MVLGRDGVARGRCSRTRRRALEASCRQAAGVRSLAAHARNLDVRIETGARVSRLPTAPVIVATSQDAAATLLGTSLPHVESGRTVLLDLARAGDHPGAARPLTVFVRRHEAGAIRSGA